MVFGYLMKRVIYGMGIDTAVRGVFDTTYGRPKTMLPSQFFTGKIMALPEFPYTVPGVGTEISVPLSKVQEAIDVILDVLSRNPIATPVAIRYVKPSKATLAFTRYEDVSVTIELPGAWGDVSFTETGAVFQMIYDALEEKREDIPHSYHWGQHFPVNDKWVKNCYGSALTTWRQQRATLLGEVGQYTFSNDLMEKLGILSMNSSMY